MTNAGTHKAFIVALLLRAILEQNRKYRKSENMGKKPRISEKVAAILVVSQQHGVPIGTKLHVFTDFRRSPDRECWSRRRRHSWRVGVIGPKAVRRIYRMVRCAKTTNTELH